MRMCQFISAALGLSTVAAASVTDLSEDEQAHLRDQLIPLPKEMLVLRKATLPPQEIGIRLRPNAGEIEQQAALELTELLAVNAGNPAKRKTFTIQLALLDDQSQLDGQASPQASRLSALPNNCQAYIIDTPGDTRLRVAALDPRGIYHGVQTVKQLLAAGLTPDAAVIPLPRIVDWPDLDERGLWNFDLDLIPWITSLKLNFAKVPSGTNRIERGKPVTTWVASTERFPNVLVEGRRRALKAVPIVAHLNYIGAKHGGYEAYPDMAGKGDEAVPTIWYKPRRIRVPCGAGPDLRRIIAECLLDLGRKGATDVSVWLSEFRGQCQCESCLAMGQLRMETQAACHAWEDVKGRFPNLRIRIFYCMGGRDAEDTYTVLSELPDEVKIERCYGQFGESFNRTATEGRWLASYAGPPLPKAEHAGLRFHGSSKTREYVNRLREQGWDAVYSINYVYSTGAYQRTLFDFHVHALAEWTWNTEGRQVSELGKAWATRKGYTRPDQVGQWIELMDPVEKALHYVISTRVWGRFPEALTQKMAIPPGRDLLAGFPHGKELVDYVDVCKRATKLAGEGNAPDLALESSYAAALCRLIEAVNSLFAIPESDESAAALLAGLRQAGNDMNRIFGERMSRVDAAPSAFAESTVKLHSELWGDRIASLTKAASAGK